MARGRQVQAAGAHRFFLRSALPSELARWIRRPKEKKENPARNPPLPPASDRYYELEAMVRSNCSIPEWDALPEIKKAEWIAHEQERNLRDAYTTEELDSATRQDDKSGGIINAMRKRIGLGRV